MKIGIFDTGLGGATVFKEIYANLNFDYIYLADNKNSPYGTKDIDTVKNLTEQNILKLIELECKIIVIACNTATSCSIDYLRNKYKDITFIGLEPAIKPALEESSTKKVLLTATSLTLNGEKLKNLILELGKNKKIEYLALDLLVQFADNYEKIRYDLAKEYLEEKFSKYNLNDFSGIVLGCTHFPIFKNTIKEIVPKEVKLYDSSIGITKQLNKIVSTLGINYPDNIKNVQLLLTTECENLRKNFYTILLGDSENFAHDSI